MPIEAANSAVDGSNLIPTIALGIPGNVAAALLIGAFMIHGVVPGPMMMIEHAELVYSICAAMLMANLLHLVIGRIGIHAPVVGAALLGDHADRLALDAQRAVAPNALELQLFPGTEDRLAQLTVEVNTNGKIEPVPAAEVRVHARLPGRIIEIPEPGPVPRGLTMPASEAVPQATAGSHRQKRRLPRGSLPEVRESRSLAAGQLTGFLHLEDLAGAHVVDHRGTGAFPGGDDGQHRRITLVGLVVEDHRVEFCLTELRDWQESCLGTGQDMRITGCKEGIAPAGP